MKSIYFLFGTIVLIISPFLALAQYVLYPPLNLRAGQVECSARLEWELPQLPGSVS